MSDELEKTAKLKDETLGMLQKHLETQELTELSILVGFYCSVARMLNATRTEIEKDSILAGYRSPHERGNYSIFL